MIKIWLGLVAIIFAGQLSASEPEARSDLVFIPSIGVTLKQLSFEQKAQGMLPSYTGEFSTILPMYSTSMTVGYKHAFIILKYEETMTDVSTGTDETGITTPSGSSQYFWEPPGFEVNVERKDQNITLGYNLISGLNVFAGYMLGETTLDVPPSCANPVVISSPPTLIYCQTYSLTWLRLRNHMTVNPGVPLEDYYQTYKEEGPYVGLSYAWNIGNDGALSLSAAYAKMNGQFKDNARTATYPGFDASGDVEGTSIGLTWTQSLSERSAYYIDVRRQAYSMAAYDQANNTEFDTDETMVSASMGMQLYF